MTSFNTYFSAKNIITLLCKFRIKYAKKRHKLHMLRDISLSSSTLQDFKNLGHCPIELSSLLPPRRLWIRLTLEERKTLDSPTQITVESLKKTILTTHLKIQNGKINAPQWYLELQKFILRVQNVVNDTVDYIIENPRIVAIPKDNKLDCIKFRPISEYKLIDRILIGQTAKYLTKIFDSQFLDCSYAFRSKVAGQKIKTHHDTVLKIDKFRQEHSEKHLYVAECDIKKFYDCVNHDHIRTIYAKFVSSVPPSFNFDQRATKFFFQYLDSYSFNKNVFVLNGSHYFISKGCPDGIFEWPDVQLKKEFYSTNFNTISLGIPQGGALSCLIANLILHNVDEEVSNVNLYPEIEYLRFCDDMVLLGTNLNACELALDRYTKAIRKNFLLIHEPKEINMYNKDFYNQTISKSKLPFEWSSRSLSNCSPWVSFVGYQVRYDGVVRIRKISIDKEIDKQKAEVDQILAAINYRDFANLNRNSRKSLQQQIFAIESRLVSMSVGRKEIHNYKITPDSFCWTNGFRVLKFHDVSRTQLKHLDSQRTRQMNRFKRTLILLSKISDKPDQQNTNYNFYFGTPFSYFSLLLKS